MFGEDFEKQIRNKITINCEWFKDLNYGEAIIYGLFLNNRLVLHDDSNNSKLICCVLTNGQISKRVNVCIRQVCRIISNLENKGYIKSYTKNIFENHHGCYYVRIIETLK